MRPRSPDWNLIAWLWIFHGSMGLSVYLASTILGWKGAFLWALAAGVIMEVKHGGRR